MSVAVPTEGGKAAAEKFAAAVLASGPSNFKGAVENIKTAANDKKNAGVRESAMLCITALAEKKSKLLEPFIVPLLPVAIEKVADAKNVAEAAGTAAQAIVDNANPTGVKNLLPPLFDALTPKNKWQSRVEALTLIGNLPKTAPKQTALALPDIVPKIAEVMGDARPEVAKGAEKCLIDACSVVGNKDIEPFIGTLVSCIARPDEVSECVYKLSATTFVSAVEPPTLAIMVPVLERGLKERAGQTRRRCAVIIDNMCKLVEVPAYAAPFLPKLLPGLDRTKEEVADPEVRAVAAKAHAQLLRAAGEDAHKTADAVAGNVAADPVKLDTYLTASWTAQGISVKEEEAFKVAKAYAVVLACALADSKMFLSDDWKASVAAYLTPYANNANKAEVAADDFRAKCEADMVVKEKVEDDEEGEQLCDCEFSLAYGAKILLNTARMALKRGHRYGLCGPNGVGKSTLMRAIANGQVEGFPSPDVLRTVYVEHDIQADQTEFSVLQYVEADPKLKGVPAGDIKAMLSSVGFTEHMQNGVITALSGGWKMKLSLARAMLTKPDIMLLDEPTNHLDKINVAWLVNYLKSLTQVTCMIVSHDSTFLDNVCTDIIHYEGFKLKRYKGNLSEFVKIRPEAKSYYELAATQISFGFPEPGVLEGVNSKGKAILKMQRVTYKYPTSDRWILTDVTINVSLSSRVVVVGPNGAGKSTMIKLLTGEIATTNGMVWKHPNLRIAYVAQHAFHHIEQHLDKTPNEYMQWRYASGDDKEAVDKEAARLTAEEEKKMAEKITLDGAKYQVEQVLNRRKLKNSYEYETSFVGMSTDKNKWLPRKTLEDLGFGKLVDQVDAREAAAAGLHSKPLTAANIAKHFAEVGLESEFTLHSRMRGLSGGQKVKVVLAAAMWHNPHMLVLDEPTNYLDRDSLGALAAAIKGFGGGVIMITHNAEFANAICTETWLVDNGRVNISGESWTKDEKLKEREQVDEVVDAAGNIIKVQQKPKELTKAEKKKIMKTRLQKIKKGEEVSDEEPWMAEFMGETA